MWATAAPRPWQFPYATHRLLSTMTAALPVGMKGDGVPGSEDRPHRPDIDLDQPRPSSRADLQQRLGRLPPWHPSSPDRTDQRPEINNGRAGSADAAAAVATGSDSPDRKPDARPRNYWTEVPGFLRAWAEHLRRWPNERQSAAVDRSRDPAGSWRGDGNQYLSPEQHTQAKEVIVGVQAAEKRVSEHVREVEQDNACGGWLEGWKFRLKGEDRLKEKIAEKVGHEPRRAPAEEGREINDAIRFTFCFEPGDYVKGYADIKQRLEAREYRMIYSKNYWHDDSEYKGINTRWISAEYCRFELQFHTPESFHAKQEVTHGSYERARNPLTGRSERREIEAFQREVCFWITMPSEVETIPDHKEKDS